MALRISDTSLLDASVRAMQREHVREAELQTQVSAGKRIDSLADDPASASQAFDLRRGLARIEMLGRTIDAARAELEHSEAALAGLGDVLARLRELAVAADRGSGDLDLCRSEVEQLFGELVAYSAGSSAVLAQIGEAYPDAPKLNLFEVITGLRDRLQARGSDGMRATIGELDSATDQLLALRDAIRARSNGLDISERQLAGVEVALKAERASLEEADLIEVASDLTSREALFQASLAVTERMLQPTLLDFLS